VREAVNCYGRQRNRILVGLDRLTMAYPGGHSLAELLDRLLEVFAQTSEAVDTSSILLLEDDGRLHVRASIGLDEEVKRAWSVAVGEGFAGTIAETRQPHLIHDVPRDRLLKSPFLRAAGIHALYGVPLIDNDQLLGVAHMGSRTAYDFSDEDKALFRVLGTRAATLIYDALLRENAERRTAELEATIDAIPGELVIADAKRGLIHANGSALSLLGVASLADAQQIGDMAARQDMRLADSGKRLTEDEIPFNRALRGETVHTDLVMRHSGHDRKIVLRTVAAPIHLHGEVIASVAIGTDITEQKTAEEQFRALANNIPQLAWIADDTGSIYWYNQRWFDYTGTTLDEMKGWGWTSVHHPEHVERVVGKIARHFASGETWEDLFPLRGRDGRYRWFLSRATPIHDESGRVVRWFGTNTDVTEQRRLEEAREQFVGILGHDLRNPLNAIMMSAQLLLRGQELDARVASGVQRIYGAGSRMRAMVNDLLDFTRGRLGGGIPVQLQEANLEALVRSVVAETEAAYPSHTIVVSVAGEAAGRLDPDRISQVIQNLVTNAIQHGDPAQPIAVAVAGTDGDTLELRVSNRGRTIPAALLPHLFEPFRRLAEAGKETRASLGLGLFIVAEIVAAHRGTVSVTSTDQEGTSFTVRLPRRALP
jgi:PAS domain S-box-containing protein